MMKFIWLLLAFVFLLSACSPSISIIDPPVVDVVESAQFCIADSDCVPSDCCHASGCVSKSSARNCAGVFCTQNCVPGSLDCGGSCACEGRRCVAKNLFVQNDDVPII